MSTLENNNNTALSVSESVPNQLIRSVGKGLASPQLGALFALASALTLGAGLITWSMQPDYVAVNEQGSRDDTLQIMEMLKSSAIPFKLDPGSGLVLVPENQATEVRLNLAASGLSQRGPLGLELLQEESSLGTSHFTETARYQHALEIELSRTIGSMRNVESARVHLALPKQSVFIRDREEASASVMIKALVGRAIEEEQVSAVTNLVASSIPYLKTDQVTVVDQWGRLLSTGDDSDSAISRDQYQYARRLEKLYAERIESLLSPVVGVGKVRAIVTAEVDFSTNERTQEFYEPDSTQLRSEENQNQRSTGSQPIGIPGALTNQPPANGVTDPAGLNPAAEPAVPVSESSTELRNYELDKTITHTRQAPGGVLRLTAAVIIDDNKSVDEAGEPVTTPLSEEELGEYTTLAQEAIGFDEARGDSVVVFNRSFQPVPELTVMEPLPIWEQAWLWTMVKQVLTGLSVLLLVLLVVRPAVKRLFANDGRQSDDIATDADGNDVDPENSSEATDRSERSVAALEAPAAVYGDILNLARTMAAEDPKRVAKVVKDWVGES